MWLSCLLCNKKKNYKQIQSLFICLQFVGFSDEILDIVYLGEGDSHLAVATNSTNVALYRVSDMSCTLLRGHTDLVLSLATSRANPKLLVSCAKVCSTDCSDR